MAKEIVWDSISSAVCVDNAFVEPYSSPGEGDDIVTPKKLFESFRKEKCSLDIYRYIDITKWEKDKEHILKNQDLLILDWELVGDPPFRDALKILRQSVELPGLSYVLIYTQQDDVSLIELNIFSYFNKHYTDISERKRKYEDFCEKLDEDTKIDDSGKLFQGLAGNFKEFNLTPPLQRSEIKKSLIDSIRKNYDGDNVGIFIRRMKDVGESILGISKIDDIFEFIGFHLWNTEVNPNEASMDISHTEGGNHSYLINNTLIMIFVKTKTATSEGESVISPEDVYTRFVEGIYKRPRNFLALLALEMKNLYRVNANNIGRELYDIDEIVFFYHQKNLDTEDEFYDFLRNSWKNQLSSFNYVQNPKLFSVLDEYKEMCDYEQLIEEYKKENLDKLRKDFVKLNYNYSFLQIDRKKNDRIRFGDMFLLCKGPRGRERKGFLLCITPHCDCLHPENIKHRLYFVFGVKVSTEEALRYAEEGFYSFLLNNDEPTCIQWSTKPFTLHIRDNINNISKPIKVIYNSSKHHILYEATQKENYTQRIANEAFSHASRVGIELAKLKPENGT
ncbi:MAG: response regulator receiver domain [Thermotogota bacterium]|nr:response regulator receiver domain [Thermotogota bacterium]